ncbi:EFR1 family ferrodoxin [Inconstantimicrobium mannanitabidum]|uniref:Iron-sulfur protein n=1 Tax=Inconstantimicrobium mannanitabidum TaxID=1604901 RepID=A0ACB5REM6_9CLOT|nr:EFR1 family ferrodoxin [Clostridium sp. TW13]GKX67585.1 iron-sulfur protein [Clostridium sp. TW13]
MSTSIFYFSGTGNSFMVAKKLANNFENADIVPISETVLNEKIHTESDCIGIVFPIYIYGIPSIISKFISKLDESFKDKYIFAVATYKSQPGGALLLLKRKLKEVEINISAGFNICMPGNNIIYYKAEPISIQNKKFLLVEKKIDEIIEIINNRSINIIERGGFFQRFLGTKIIHGLATKSFYKLDKNYWVNDNCSGCGLCEKICPVKNININNGKPTWNHRCEQCVACLNLCPKQAIQYNKSTINKLRYKNPYIETNELFK